MKKETEDSAEPILTGPALKFIVSGALIGWLTAVLLHILGILH